MYLVQYHSRAEVGRKRSLKYWTTIEEANGLSTVEEYKDKTALLNEWGPEVMYQFLKYRPELKLNMP